MQPSTLIAACAVRMEDLMSNIVRASVGIAAALVVAACAGGSSPTIDASATPSSEPAASASTVASASPSAPSPAVTVSPSASAATTSFTSKTYGYSLTLPAGWTAIQATKAWDGKGAPFHDVPQADQFISRAASSAWLFEAPTTKDLAGKVKESIAINAAEHSDTCPAVPEVNDPIDIGGEAAVLLGWDCGILINNAIAVHDGNAYLFGFRDPAIHAANDPADRATFLELLHSVTFPE